MDLWEYNKKDPENTFEIIFIEISKPCHETKIIDVQNTVKLKQATTTLEVSEKCLWIAKLWQYFYITFESI